MMARAAWLALACCALPLRAAVAQQNALVIDAAHSPEQPGAVAPTGELEVDFTLSMASRIAGALAAHAIPNVHVSRHGSRWPSIVMSEKAAGNRVFVILVHTLGMESPHGGQVYYCRDDPASRALAAELGRALTGAPLSFAIVEGTGLVRNEVCDSRATLVFLSVGTLGNPDELRTILSGDFQEDVATRVARAASRFLRALWTG